MNQRRLSGFTIVELLIVIVVIAILASVTVVAFNGVSKRAANASVESTLAQSEKALRIYKELENKPLYASDEQFALYGIPGNQYYLAHWGMQGACLAGDWPSPQEMANDIAPNDGWVQGIAQNDPPSHMMWLYCSHFMNTQHAAALAGTIKDSQAAQYFPKMPTISPVTFTARNTDGSTSTITQRGIRYGYNGSIDAPVSYLYYGVYGKTCLEDDRTVRFSSTNAPGVGPGGVFPGFSETGGDYTADDTAYCVREIRY